MRRCASAAALGRIGLGDAEHQHAAGGQRPHLLEPVRAVEHGRDQTVSIRMPCSTSSPSQAPDESDRAALANRRGTRCGVSNAVSKTASTPSGQPRADRRDQPVAAREDDVGAEARGRAARPAGTRPRARGGRAPSRSGSRRTRARPAPPVTASVCPSTSPSRSRPCNAVRPFIGSVAACSRVTPSGIGTTDAAGATSSSACAPPSGRRGRDRRHHLVADRQALDAVARPTRRRPRQSIPGTQGGGTPSTPRCRSPMSVGFTAAAATASRTSPGPAVPHLALDHGARPPARRARVIPTARAVVTAAPAGRRRSRA